MRWSISRYVEARRLMLCLYLSVYINTCVRHGCGRCMYLSVYYILLPTCRKDFRAGLLKSPSPSAWTRVVERWWPDCDMDRLLRKRDLRPSDRGERVQIRGKEGQGRPDRIRGGIVCSMCPPSLHVHNT